MEFDRPLIGKEHDPKHECFFGILYLNGYSACLLQNETIFQLPLFLAVSRLVPGSSFFFRFGRAS